MDALDLACGSLMRCEERIDRRAIMRFVRGTIGTLLAATLLTLAIGLQVLEATGRWDLTFQDTGDEAIIVVVVLCIGAALVVAGVIRPRFPLAAIHEPLVLRLSLRLGLAAPPAAWSSSNTSPPLSLRI